MTTQPHAIPSKQDELAGLYDQELEAMWGGETCRECRKPNVRPATHRLRGKCGHLGDPKCAEHISIELESLASFPAVLCGTCGDKRPPKTLTVVPL